MRSPITYLLKRAYQRSAAPFSPQRREFLKKSVMATTALSLPLGGCNWFNDKPVIAIVGAGISGVNTAYQLKKNNIATTIYEATSRPGGRVLTVADAVVDGAHVDFGAEYLDTQHVDIMDLAKELQVEIVDLNPDPLIGKYYYFGGRKFTENDLVKAMQPFAERLTHDVNVLPAELHYNNSKTFSEFDSKTVTEYLKDIGISGWLYDFFDIAITGEYAMESSMQSAVNLLYILSIPIGEGDRYHVLGGGHEVYKFKGGTQRFIDKLSATVKDQIKTGYQLVELNEFKKGYELIFSVDGKRIIVEADMVLLTLPFTVLRDIKMNFKFPNRKQRCIDTVGFGFAAKTAMGFHKRVWREQGYQGYTYTDVNRTAIWDSSQGVDITSGSLSFVTGGNESIDFQNLDYAAIKERWLGGAEIMYPGLAAQYNGRISKFCWAQNPYSKGSYTCYTRGQWTDFIGVEQEPFGNIFFAGENCSVNHQGYMNGAVESSNKAAIRIMDSLKIKNNS